MLNITSRPKRMELEDYSNLGVLGEGGFGVVCLYKHNGSGRMVAVKKMKKKQIIESKQVDHIKNEVYIMNACKHPNLVYMEGINQTNKFIMIGMEYVRGGEFFNYLRSVGKVSFNQGVFYAAQIVLMLEYLHSHKIAYRDLKPENLILDEEGYLKLTDFGFAKRLEGRTYTFCGTTEYLAPEIILNKGHSFPVDWWALGVLIYEMLVGIDPFNAPDPMVVYDKIIKLKFSVPSHVPTAAKSIIERLLEPDLDKRFGNLVNSFNDVKNHQFFDSIKWDKLTSREINPPYRPTKLSDSALTAYEKSKELAIPGLLPTNDPFLDW